MAQQGGTGKFRRDRVLEALAILSINDDYFLTHIRDNLEPTLWDYGFALSPDEMEEVRKYLGDHAHKSDKEIINLLETLERRRW